MVEILFFKISFLGLSVSLSASFNIEEILLSCKGLRNSDFSVESCDSLCFYIFLMYLS